MRIKNFFRFVIAIAVSEAAGIIRSFFTVSDIPNWYDGLVKPVLNPPAWVFGPVWTTLYAFMCISLFLVWNRHSLIRANERMMKIWKIGVIAFFVQLSKGCSHFLHHRNSIRTRLTHRLAVLG